MPKGNLKEPLHPTVAVSDAFMATCALYAFTVSKSQPCSALGYLMCGIACSAGVLRFGFAPETFRPFNEVFAQLTGQVGVPMMGLGFVNTDASLRSVIPFGDLEVLFALVMTFAFASALPKAKAELITTVLSAVSMGAIFKVAGANRAEVGDKFFLAQLGVGLFVFGGLVITPDRNRCLFGVRRENLFHYCLGLSMYLMAQATF